MTKMALGAQPLGYPSPVFVIGTYGEADEPNIMTASWAGVVSTHPPVVSVSLRPATYTHGSIVVRGAFTLSVPSEKQMREADMIGILSGRNHDKFKLAGLTPVRATKVDAPYPEEMPLVLECRAVEALNVGSHTMFLGVVEEVLADPHVVEPSSHGVLPQMERLRPLIFSPGNFHYYGVGERYGRAFSVGRPSWLQRKRKTG